MDKAMPSFAFNMMAFSFKLRDLLQPRGNILKEVGIQPGFHVLDYGCGPGGYVSDAAELVGESGRVFALDMHPLATRSVEKIAEKRGLANVQTIHSDHRTELPDGSIDVVLLYDVFHALNDPYPILAELHRVLKPNGVLSFSDHHMSQEEIVSAVTNGRLFSLSRQGEKTYSFVKQD